MPKNLVFNHAFIRVQYKIKQFIKILQSTCVS